MPIGGLAILQKCGCNCNPQNTGADYRHHLLIKWNYKQFVFSPSVPMEIFKNKKKVQKRDCRQLEIKMNFLLAGNAQDTRPCQPSYTSHPAPIQKVLCIFMHLYTPLALILLFWLTSVAALACGRSTNVQRLTSIVFISQKERVKSFVVVDSHQGWNHVRSLNCFQCFVKKKVRIHNTQDVCSEITSAYKKRATKGSNRVLCLWSDSLLSSCVAFPGTCDSDGSIFTSYFYTWHKYAWAARSTASLHLLSSTVSV